MLNDLLCASIQWDKVGIVLGLIAGIAVLLAVAILIVTKVCHITEDEKVLKVLDKNFIKAIKNINVSAHLMNLTVVLWAGRSIVYASYDDATITLPFYEKYQADTAVKYRDDLIALLDALKLLRNE